MPSFRLCRPSFVVAFRCRWRKVSANYAGHGTRVQDLYVTSAIMILQVEDPWEVFGYFSDYASCIWSRFTVCKVLSDLKQTSCESWGSYHGRRYGS